MISPAIHGVVLLDKPAGITSQTAVTIVKRIFGAQKAGHTGTLDPMASGLLPVCLGEATKYSQDLLDADKTYLADIRWGQTTNTGDAEG
jgi:tRNA pseudouridine55 synthase